MAAPFCPSNLRVAGTCATVGAARRCPLSRLKKRGRFPVFPSTMVPELPASPSFQQASRSPVVWLSQTSELVSQTVRLPLFPESACLTKTGSLRTVLRRLSASDECKEFRAFIHVGSKLLVKAQSRRQYSRIASLENGDNVGRGGSPKHTWSCRPWCTQGVSYCCRTCSC